MVARHDQEQRRAKAREGAREGLGAGSRVTKSLTKLQELVGSSTMPSLNSTGHGLMSCRCRCRLSLSFFVFPRLLSGFKDGEGRVRHGLRDTLPSPATDQRSGLAQDRNTLVPAVRGCNSGHSGLAVWQLFSSLGAK
jgi:hypothetical protein